MKKWKQHGWMILTGLFLICVVCGVWGLVESGKLLFDACYVTLQMITLNAGFEDGEKSWQIQLARFVLPGIFAYAAITTIWTVAKQHFSSFRLKFFVNDHYVICGLGDRGMALARDLIAQHCHVVAIEIDPNNPHKMAFAELGGLLIEGDACEEYKLQEAKLGSASNLILLTSSDATNLKILSQALAHQGTVPCIVAQTKQKFYVHIANRENRALFDVNGVFFPPNQRKGLETGLFNVHENAAIALFQDNVLGANVDTVSQDAEPVRLLIVGFGRMGEAVVVEAMQLGHFCNHIPISITVVCSECGVAKQRFMQNYREVSNHLGHKGLRLWNLTFIDTIDQAGSLGRYSDILSCHDDEDMALVGINELWDRRQCEAGQRPARFFHYSPSGRNISNNDVIAFGGFNKACSKNLVIAGENDTMAKAKSDGYAQTTIEKKAPELYAQANATQQWEDAFIQYDQQTNPVIPQEKKLTWKNMSLLKQSSNLTALRHYGIKLHELGLKSVHVSGVDIDTSRVKATYPYLNEFSDIDVSARKLIAHALKATQLEETALVERIHQMGMAEHNRWNAFHVLNNFRSGQKDETKRTHDCLLNWEELTARKPDDLKWDYQNIYQMLDILRLIDCGVAAIHTDKEIQ